MPSLTIKDIPDEIYLRLKERARQHRRSINSEAIECLEQVLRCVPRDARELIARARDVRASSAVEGLTDEELAALKAEGRR